MRNYLDLLQFILDHGVERPDRTGVGTLSVFGLQAKYDLSRGFPAITTKKLAWKSMVSELLWFISGSGNIHDLKRIYPYNKLWDLNYHAYLKRQKLSFNDGSMGRVYGQQWRHWQTTSGGKVDQLQAVIEQIQHNPTSRRMIVNAWHPGETDSLDIALPPCHSFFQFYVAKGKLSLQMYQRSADMFLGVPLNIASYALLLHMIAKLSKLVPGELIHIMGDAHIYLDTINQCHTQLNREPQPLPKLVIEDRGQHNINDFVMTDFSLSDYRHHPAIKAQMAV